MQLKTLLSEHSRIRPPHSLKKNLGDGYLLHHSPIYNSIRKESLRIGFKFSSKRLHDYDSLPLTQLPIILSKKTIPYVDNVNPLLEVEALAPDTFSWNEVPPLKANYLMHESAHAIARNLRLKFFKKLELPKGKAGTERLILGTLLEEAFANTTECLANLDSKSDLHDEFLYKNSYIMEKPRDRAKLRAAISSWGKPVVFKVILISYLFANFLRLKPSENDFDRIKRILGMVGGRAEPRLPDLFQIGLNLDPAFTQFTGSFCFRLLGIQGNIYEFLNFDFMRILEGDRRYIKWMEALAEVIGFDETIPD